MRRTKDINNRGMSCGLGAVLSGWTDERKRKNPMEKRVGGEQPLRKLAVGLLTAALSKGEEQVNRKEVENGFLR